jgi:serine/threonine protein kinase
MAPEQSAMARRSLDEQAVFEVARKIGVSEAREAYLLQVCGGDAAIERRVRALLRAYDEGAEFLESPAASLVTALEEPMRERRGMAIGPYRLLEQIGEGGMGLVFMAEQERPVRRKVALKVLKPGLDTRQVVARFEAERQALALMDHPHIAKIHDAGTTESGRPYFVMELVRGVPITEFCDERRLTPRQRLEQFVLVCRAVQHAHQRGIIYRDLKPSNVLVTLHDTVAVPKVIDFGIAKATTERLTEQTLFTHFAQMVGTPLYMSPEQAEMNGLDVDTRSDVYALGVLLYELLTGTTPFESDTLKKVGYDEMRRIIREEEPPMPSRRLSTLSAERQSTMSERRGVDCRQLGRLLRSDLDWVVTRALEKDRNRRYESASALAADVERYLADEPVEAGRPSNAYRLRKFVRRNRRLLAVTGLFALVLVVATAISTWQAVKAREAQRKSEVAESRATNGAAIAQAVNDFLLGDLLGQVDSLPKFGNELSGFPDLTVREAMDRAAAKIGERFQDQPLIEAAIRTVIGQGYQSLGKHQLAVGQLEQAIKLRQAHLGSEHPDTLASTSSLAGAYMWAGRHSDAIALRQQILEYRKARLGPDHPETLDCVCALAEAYHLASRCEMSIPLLEQTLEKQRTVYGPTHPATVGTMQQLAWNYSEARRYSESLALHQEVLDAFKSANSPGQEPPIRWLITFGLTCQRAGKLDQADPLLRQALEENRKQEDSVTQRIGRCNIQGLLALNLLLQERYDEAEPLIRQAVEGYEKRLPGQFRMFLWMTIHGAVLTGQQRYAEAEPLLLQGYEGMKQREAMATSYEWDHAQAGKWVVRFYEVTNQPEKAREWREKLAAARRADRDP